MRWGIPGDASDDHSTVDLCMREIDHCKKLSFGTYFIVKTTYRTRSCKPTGGVLADMCAKVVGGGLQGEGLLSYLYLNF